LAAGVKVATAPEHPMVPGTGVAPGPVTVNAAAGKGTQLIGSLKVALMTWPAGTPVAVFTGIVETTTGGGVIVVNVHTELAASGMPEALVAPVVIVAVYWVLYARLADGMNVATTPVYVTVPATAVPPGPVNVKVDALIVVGFIGSLNVALNVWPMATFVAPFTGSVDTTAGGGVTVLKVQT
jgi:hypothetical protein